MGFWGPFFSIVSKYGRRHKASVLLPFHLLLVTIYRFHGETPVFSGRWIQVPSVLLKNRYTKKTKERIYDWTLGRADCSCWYRGLPRTLKTQYNGRFLRDSLVCHWALVGPPSKGCAPLWCLLSFSYIMKESMTYVCCWNPHPNYSKLNIIKYT